MRNNGTVYIVPDKNPNLKEIKFKLDKIFTDKQLRAKLYYFILKMYNKKNLKIPFSVIYDVCEDYKSVCANGKGYSIRTWLEEIERIGVIIIRKSYIELNMWDRRSHKIVPRNFVRIIDSLVYFDDIEKQYHQIQYGFVQRIKLFFKNLFDK